jgi:hypothetical protein
MRGPVGGRFGSGVPIWLISRFGGRMPAIGVAGGGAARLELDHGHPPVPADRWLYRAACWFRASARLRGGARDRRAGHDLRVQLGSGVHGTAVSGHGDRDEMGLCLEPRQFVTGLARVPDGTGGLAPSVRFEQYERHTAWDRPGGVANRSGAGDTDVIIYSARKWGRLALAGNPTVLLVLFVPDEEVVFRNQAGAELVANAHRFVSRLAAGRFLGYLGAQKAAMTGQAGAHTNRPELVAVHGYDTKYAMHALRLGLQGTELLTTGRITLPVPEPDRGYLRSIRRGERPLAEVLDAITGAEARLTELRDSPAIPAQPDRRWVDDWLHRSYLDFWARRD